MLVGNKLHNLLHSPSLEAPFGMYGLYDPVSNLTFAAKESHFQRETCQEQSLIPRAHLLFTSFGCPHM